MRTTFSALLVLGGGPAGHAAATAYRDQGGTESVCLLTADREPPYVRPLLSKEFLRGDADSADLPLEDADGYTRRDIEVRTATVAEELDVVNHRVRTDAGAEIEYGNCVIATGADPVRPPVPGADHPEVRVLRSAADAHALRTAADQGGDVVVVGSGFIGCEAAVSLARRGVAVTVLSRESVPQQQRLGRTAGERLHDWLAGEGVILRDGVELTRIEGGHRVHTGEAEPIDAGLVLLATGMRPNTGPAERAGLPLRDGRIIADGNLRAAPEVYVAGDAALAYNVTAGRALPVEHWGDAETMGQLAGRAAAGHSQPWDAVPGFWSVIGDRVLKYTAWGDGFDEASFVDHGSGAFTVWYGYQGRTVGVLTHERDEDYERGERMVREHQPLPG